MTGSEERQDADGLGQPILILLCLSITTIVWRLPPTVVRLLLVVIVSFREVGRGVSMLAVVRDRLPGGLFRRLFDVLVVATPCSALEGVQQT